jgi:hypothetical protein
MKKLYSLKTYNTKVEHNSVNTSESKLKKVNTSFSAIYELQGSRQLF